MTLIPASTYKRAREIVSDPKNWGKGRYCTDLDGNPGDMLSAVPEQHCFCFVGALGKAEVELHGSARIPNHRLHAMAEHDAVEFEPSLAERDIAVWNDSHFTRHEDVLDLFDKLIAKAGG